MSNEYMPRKDAEAAIWMRTFADALLTRPDVFHVTTGEAQAIADAAGRFADALSVACDPATRTTPMISVKNDFRARAEDACRPVYLAIRANKGIADPDKIAAGVRPMKSRYEKRSAPTEPPLLVAGKLTWTQYEVEFRTLANRRAKPTSATQLQLFRAVGEAPATSAEQAQYYCTASRGPVGVNYTGTEDGAVTTYFGRWISPRGETGPWSAPLVIRVASRGVDFARKAA